MSTEQEDRFRAAYSAHVRPLLAFAARRTSTLADAADVVADTMLVVWRRIDDLPPEPETRLWLFGVARHVMANQRRGQRRRDRLGQRLRAQLVEVSAEIEPMDTAMTGAIRAGLERLSPIERDVMVLTAGERLTPTEIAAVLNMNASTVRTNLQRARAKLRNHLTARGFEIADGPRRSRRTGHDGIEAQLMPRSHGPEEVSG